MSVVKLMVMVLDNAQGSTMQEKGEWLYRLYMQPKFREHADAVLQMSCLTVGICSWYMKKTDDEIYEFFNNTWFAKGNGCFGRTLNDGASKLLAEVCEEMGATRLVSMIEGGVEREKKSREMKERLNSVLRTRKNKRCVDAITKKAKKMM